MSRDRVAAAALLLFGLAGALCLVALALLVRRAPAAPPPAAIPAERPRYGKVVLALGAAAAYAFALESLGFVVTTFLFLLFVLSAVEPRRWSSSLALAAGTSLASHLLFKVGLAVQLPAGPWGF